METASSVATPMKPRGSLRVSTTASSRSLTTIRALPYVLEPYPSFHGTTFSRFRIHTPSPTLHRPRRPSLRSRPSTLSSSPLPSWSRCTRPAAKRAAATRTCKGGTRTFLCHTLFLCSGRPWRVSPSASLAHGSELEAAFRKGQGGGGAPAVGD
jgi:hypothetical protein